MCKYCMYVWCAIKTSNVCMYVFVNTTLNVCMYVVSYAFVFRIRKLATYSLLFDGSTC